MRFTACKNTSLFTNHHTASLLGSCLILRVTLGGVRALTAALLVLRFTVEDVRRLQWFLLCFGLTDLI